MSKIKTIIDDTTGKVKESFFTVKVGYDHMKENFEEGSENMLNSLKKLTDISTLSKDKLFEFTNKIIGLSPMLESIGFSMNSISVGVTLPPKISISLSKMEDVKEEQIKKILAENKDNEILSSVINTLLSISYFQSKLSLANYELAGIDIDISIPPGVNLKLKKKEVDNSKK